MSFFAVLFKIFYWINMLYQQFTSLRVLQKYSLKSTSLKISQAKNTKGFDKSRSKQLYYKAFKAWPANRKQTYRVKKMLVRQQLRLCNKLLNKTNLVLDSYVWPAIEVKARKQKWEYLQLIKYYERAGYACNRRLERRLTTAFFNWRNKLVDSQRWYRHEVPHISNYRHTIAIIHDNYAWKRKNYLKRLHSPYPRKLNVVIPVQNLSARFPLYFWHISYKSHKVTWHRPSKVLKLYLQKIQKRHRESELMKQHYYSFLAEKEELRVQGLVYGQPPHFHVWKSRLWSDFVSEYKQGLYFLAKRAHRVWYKPIDWSKPKPKPKPKNSKLQVLHDIYCQYAEETFLLDKATQQQFLNRRRKWTPHWQFMARGYRVGDIAYRWPSEFPKRSYFYRPIWRRPFAFIEYREYKKHVLYHRHVWSRFMKNFKHFWKTRYGGVFLRRSEYEHGLYQGQVLLMDQYTGIPAHDVLLDQKLWGDRSAKSGFKTVGCISQGSWRWAHPRNTWFSGRLWVPGYFGHLRYHKTFFSTLGWETYARRIVHMRSTLLQTPAQRWVLAQYEKVYRDKLAARPDYLRISYCGQLLVLNRSKFQKFSLTESLFSEHPKNKFSLVLPLMPSKGTKIPAYPDEWKYVRWLPIKGAQQIGATPNAWQGHTPFENSYLALGEQTLYIYSPALQIYQVQYISQRAEISNYRWFNEYRIKWWKDLGRLQEPQELLRLRPATKFETHSNNWEQIQVPEAIWDLPLSHGIRSYTLTTQLFDARLPIYDRLLSWDACAATIISKIYWTAQLTDNKKLYSTFPRVPVNCISILNHNDSSHYGEWNFFRHPTNYGSSTESRITTSWATNWNAATYKQRRFAILLQNLQRVSRFSSFIYTIRELWITERVPRPFDDPERYSNVYWLPKHKIKSYNLGRWIWVQVKPRLLDIQPTDVKRIINLYPIFWQNFFNKPRGVYRVCPWEIPKIPEWEDENDPTRPKYAMINYAWAARQEHELVFWPYFIHFCGREAGFLYLMGGCREAMPRYSTDVRNRAMTPARHWVYWQKLILHLKKYEIPSIIDEDLPPWIPWSMIFYSGWVKEWVFVGQETMQPGWICLKNFAFLNRGWKNISLYSGVYGRDFEPMLRAGFTHGFVVGMLGLRSARARWWTDYEVHLVYMEFHRKYSTNFRGYFFETDMPETGTFGIAKHFDAWPTWIPIFGSRVRYWNFLAQCSDYGGWEKSCVFGRVRSHIDLIRWKINDSRTHGGYPVEIPRYSYRFNSSKRQRDFFYKKLYACDLNSRGLILKVDAHIPAVKPKVSPNTWKGLTYYRPKAASTTRYGYSGYWSRWLLYTWTPTEFQTLRRSTFTIRRKRQRLYLDKFVYAVTSPRIRYKKLKQRLHYRFRYLKPSDYERVRHIFLQSLNSPKIWAGIEIWISEWYNESLYDYGIDRVVERLKPFVERQRDPTRGLYEWNPHYWMCHHSGRVIDELDDPCWENEFYKAITTILFAHIAEGYKKLQTETPHKSEVKDYFTSADAHSAGRHIVQGTASWLGLLLMETNGKTLPRVHDVQWYWRRKHAISLLGRLVYKKEPRIHRSEARNPSNWEFLFENYDRWYKRDLCWRRDQEYRRINHNFPYQHPRHYKRQLRKFVNKWA